ncbi:hypothetical protein SAMN04488587_1938 [Methanococcoides vulcani]|uniref:Transglutaminase-like superfamily protein n=1 Tax=Methanococcoides vulcani TaxID=1353158 RepID=A0A1I0B3A3_9EURY|nr:hypothetical protein [Methanococcoides vulcani]SET01229.1 hypothetical protein SAMN04488587_1938 [Methanococcoides vulcani]
MGIKRSISWFLFFMIICSGMGCIADDGYPEENGLPDIDEPDTAGEEYNEEYNITLKKTAILDLENGYSLKILDINRKEEFTVISFRKDEQEYSVRTLLTGQTYNVKDPEDRNNVYSIRVDKIYDSSFTIDLTYELKPEIFQETEPIESETEIKIAVSLDEDSITRTYEWEYDNTEFWIKNEYYKEDYDLYSERSRSRDYDQFANDPYDDELISQITSQLEYLADEGGYGSDEIPYIATAFVQSLPYVSDSASAGYDEYPRFPFETLYHGGGDCEDSSILLASLLHEMGYGVALITLPDHMAVGVQGDESVSGSYYDYNGIKYFYLETTNSGWDVGVIPDEYQNSEATITPIGYGYPQLQIEFTGTSKRGAAYTYVDLDIEITNVGSATAEDVTIYTYLESTDEGMGWDQIQSDVIPEIEAEGGMSYTVTNLKVPVGQEYRVGVMSWGSNAEQAYVYSDWVVA